MLGKWIILLATLWRYDSVDGPATSGIGHWGCAHWMKQCGKSLSMRIESGRNDLKCAVKWYEWLLSAPVDSVQPLDGRFRIGPKISVRFLFFSCLVFGAAKVKWNKSVALCNSCGSIFIVQVTRWLVDVSQSFWFPTWKQLAAGFLELTNARCVPC